MTTQDPFGRHLIDLDLAESGAWFEINGDQFKIARVGNDSVAPCRVAFLNEKGQKPDQDVPADLREEWYQHMFGHTILKDVKFAGSPETKYKPEMGARIWRDPQLADLKGEILKHANGSYTVERLRREAILGNSEASSNGNESAGHSGTRSEPKQPDALASSSKDGPTDPK